MTKKITPNFLRHCLALIIFSQSLFIFSQTVDITIRYSWPNYSKENRIELYAPNNDLIATLDDGYTGSTSNTSANNLDSPLVVSNRSINDNIPSGSGYYVILYDTYGDGWNGNGYATINVDGEDILTVNDNNFTGLSSSGGGTVVSNRIYFAVNKAPNLDDASFTYPNNSYSISDADPTPTITGETGGTFTATAGLVINATTGVIDLSESTIANHTITYTTNDPDQSSSQQNITINFAKSQYHNTSKKYIEYIPGTMPVIISAPHGGRLTGGELTTRSCGTGEMDDNTDVLIREIQKKCFDEFGVYPYIIINNLRRNKLDPNRTKSVATCNNTSAYEYFDAYHDFIDQASADVNTKFGKGLYIDLHGQSHSIPRIEAGYNLPSSSFDEDLNNTSTNAAELARVTIKNLIENNLQNLTFEDLVRGSESFGGLMQVTGGAEYAALGHAGCGKTEGYRTVPSHIGNGGQGSCDDTNPGSNAYFAGDYYSNIRHGSGSTSNANSVVGGGGTVNGGGGTIDGIMTEVNRRVRDLGNAYASTYGVSDSRSATIPYFSRDYAKVLEKFIDLHYNDFSNFSYDNTSYSINGINTTPTIQGISGGEFSSTSGLDLNTVTGEINVASSTPGTYTITYKAPNVGSFYKKETEITINTDEVTNEFTVTTGNWSEPSNWSLNREPIATDNVLIPSGNTAYLDGNQKSINDITVEGNLTINSDKSLTVAGNLDNTGNFTIASGASLIVNGTATGNLVYNRNIDGNKWYLIGSPLAGQTIVDFANNHPSIAKGSGSGTDRNIALAPFDNSKANSLRWSYYKVGQVDEINGDDTADLLAPGKGFTTRLTSNGTLAFTGTINTENVARTVTQGTNSFNLVANPYTSYLSSADFLTQNSGLGKSLKTQTLWIWNQNLNGGLGDYDTRVTVQNFEIAPGQAFFVEVENTNDINFSAAAQSHQNTDTFLKSERPEIKLNITDGTNIKFTEIYYIDGTTTGFDNGYDGEIFNGVSSNFQVFSGLVSKTDEKKLSIQSLPNSNHEAMIIPIGINAKSGTEIEFSTEIKNLPAGLNVYLEDTSKNTFTKLSDSNSKHKIVLEEDLNGTGNFYLHTRAKVLATETEVLDNVSIYSSKGKVTVNGIVNSDINLSIFTILGSKVYKTNFTSNGRSEITLPKLSKGVYLLQIKSSTNNITKKIILE